MVFIAGIQTSESNETEAPYSLHFEKLSLAGAVRARRSTDAVHDYLETCFHLQFNWHVMWKAL